MRIVLTKQRLGFKTLILPLLFLMFLTMAQNASGQQTVKGTIIDTESEAPLIGATITLVSSDSTTTTVGAVSDVEGNFVLKNVPLGRQNFIVNYIGYKSLTLPNVLITAGKEVYLTVKLEESLESLDAIVVTADSDKDKPLNDMSVVSARTFNLEEVTRFAGGRLDVARLVSNFAGVSTSNDSRNDIVIRGNSPTGVLWRLEGIPIPNPNHFATLGTTGGPVSALNPNLLSTSDFMTGAFASEYGNATAGVFDVNFRSGNPDKFEATIQLGAVAGVEALLEGPLSRKNNSSFLISYRYSFVSLGLIPIGSNAVPNYQDISFKFNFGNTKAGRFQLFGMGGLSDIEFLASETDENDLFANPNQDARADSKLGIVGLSHQMFWGKDTYLKTVVSTSAAQSLYNQDNYLNLDGTRTKFRAVEIDDLTTTYSISSQLNSKISPRFTLRTGFLYEFFNVQSQNDSRNNKPDLDQDGLPDWEKVRDFEGSLPLIQLFAQGKYKFSDNITLNTGLHFQYLNFNQSTALEPRLGLTFDLSNTQSLSIAYGLHSQMQSLPILLYETKMSDGTFKQTNKDLGFTQSHHFVLAYDWKFAPDWRLKVETYYQNIQNVPIESRSSSYSALNLGANFVSEQRGFLVNEGTGSNYGLEITLEKFFNQNYYVLLTGSLFESKYKGSDGIERNTAFNNRHVLNLLAGKEFQFGKDDRNAITLDTKITTAGGRFYTPVDLEATRANNGAEVLQEENAFSERFEPYFRWDFKVGYRLNSQKRKISQQFFLDFQNLTNRENIFQKRYNEVTDQVNEVYQLGFFVDILYRIQF